jgi:ferric enterobactin receptor
MKSLFIFHFFIFLFLPITLFCQKQIQIKGCVVDSATNLPLEFATLILLNENKTVVKTFTTSNEGSFEWTMNKTGNYVVCISLIGYKKYYSKQISVYSNKIIDLGRIHLQGDGGILDEVVVKNRKTLIKNKGDKLVYNAKADIGNKAGSAMDVLRNAPMVNVDATGGIKLRGNSNIKVLLNGQPSNIMAKNLKEALKTIPAGTIESIEVITTPSAKYEAEGAAGIINIITKKKSIGTNGTIDLSAGNLEQSISAELNVAKGKFDYNLSLSSIREKENNKSELKRTSLNNGVETGYLLQNTQAKQRYMGSNIDLSVDYQMDSTQKIGTTISFWKDNMPLISSLYNLYESKQNKSEYIQTGEQKDKFIFIDFSINYQKKFKRKGQELQLVSQFNNNADKSDYITNQVYLSEQQFSSENSFNTSNSKDLGFQADYAHPFDKSGKNILETGIRYGRNISTSKYSVFNNNFSEDLSRSDDMEYYQNIYAAYFSFKIEIQNEWTFRPGLRYESTRLGGDFKRNEPSFKASFSNWVPCFLITKKIREKHDIKLNYTERIRRPWLWDLNPYVNASDPRNITYGNPHLRPEITRMLEAGYMYSATSGFSFNNSIYFNSNTNGIESLSEVDSLGVSRTTPRNIATIQRMGTNVNLYMPINENWLVSSDIEFYHVWFESKALFVKNDANFYSISLNSSYTFPADLTIQVSGDYNNGNISLQGESSSFYTYRFSIRKEFFKSRASLTVNVNNPFQNSQVQWNYLKSQTFNSKSSDWYYNRSFTVSFSWRFGGSRSVKENMLPKIDEQSKQEGPKRRLPGKK